MNKLNLTEIVEAINFHSDELHALINTQENTVCVISEEALFYAEHKNNDYPDWMQDEIEQAKVYLTDSSKFISLPSQHDANEFNMMVEFTNALTDESNNNALLKALQGKGAFRRFKDTINYLNIADSWYAFREKRYRDFALKWCKEEGLEVEI